MARQSVAEMLGEFMREAGCLVVVFGFLDRLKDNSPPGFGYMFGVVGLSAVLLVAGMAIERRRKE